VTNPSLGARYWDARFRSWPPQRSLRPGYTVLVPVPGDLPVFLELALAVIAAQRADERVATLVIPDRMTPAVRHIVDQHRRTWSGALELVPLMRPERWVLPRFNNAARNHPAQIISGVRAARSTHVVLHDADLFVLRPDFLDQHYRSCRDRQLACLGVDPVWDGWFADHGRHLAATWELCASVPWIRSFTPSLHFGHEDTLFGERHVFDTMLYPQAISHPDLIGVERSDDIIHFNYVISAYRGFQREGTSDDNRFLLLFIRLLIDVFDPTRAATYAVPTLAELAASLEHRNGPVTYREGPEAETAYQRFRHLLSRALSGPWADEQRRDEVVGALEPFDRRYRYATGPATEGLSTRP
jgi:hypothetical protein